MASYSSISLNLVYTIYTTLIGEKNMDRKSLTRNIKLIKAELVNYSKKRRASNPKDGIIDTLIFILHTNLKSIENLMKDPKTQGDRFIFVDHYIRSITRAFNTDILSAIEKDINKHLDACDTQNSMGKKIDKLFETHEKHPKGFKWKKIAHGLRIIRNAYAHADPKLWNKDKEFLKEIAQKKYIKYFSINNEGEVVFEDNSRYFLSTIILAENFLIELNKLSKK